MEEKLLDKDPESIKHVPMSMKRIEWLELKRIINASGLSWRQFSSMIVQAVILDKPAMRQLIDSWKSTYVPERHLKASPRNNLSRKEIKKIYEELERALSEE